MEDSILTYRFWFWAPKLNGILAMLSELAKYEISDDEIEGIKVGLINTCEQENVWFDYILHGKLYDVNLKFAYDEEEGPEMIHITIQTSSELEQKLQALNLFQCLFRRLDLENGM